MAGSHPNTVCIYDYGHTADGLFYYAIEYLRGADLRRIVERSGPMSAARVIHVLSQACGALAEAHGKGLIRRDIKAANIMLCEQGGELDVVKLLDFGLVQELGKGGPARAQEVSGTPETISPEVRKPRGKAHARKTRRPQNRAEPQSRSRESIAGAVPTVSSKAPGRRTKCGSLEARSAEPECLGSWEW